MPVHPERIEFESPQLRGEFLLMRDPSNPAVMGLLRKTSRDSAPAESLHYRIETARI